jgi:hypothetical protein
VTLLVERDLILAPLASADPFLRAFFASHPAIAVVEPVRRPGDRTLLYSIHWEAESRGLSRKFDGELIVEPDEAFNGFWLILTGAIARSAARDLLREMRVEIEALARAKSATTTLT